MLRWSPPYSALQSRSFVNIVLGEKKSSCTQEYPAKPSLSIPHPRNLRMSHLLLQLKNPIHQRLARGRATGHIDVDGDDPIAPPRHAVTVVIVPSPISTRAHADHPAGFGHLVVDLAQSRSHLIGQSSSHDHHIRLAGRGAEDYAKTVLIIPRGREVHHLNGTAGKSKSHGPERALASPVGDLVGRCSARVGD